MSSSPNSATSLTASDRSATSAMQYRQSSRPLPCPSWSSTSSGWRRPAPFRFGRSGETMRFLAATALALLIAATASSAQTAKPIVYVLSTGGTIAGSGSSSTDLSNYKPGAILGEQLVKAVPQIAQIAD